MFPSLLPKRSAFALCLLLFWRPSSSRRGRLLAVVEAEAASGRIDYSRHVVVVGNHKVPVAFAPNRPAAANRKWYTAGASMTTSIRPYRNAECTTTRTTTTTTLPSLAIASRGTTRTATYMSGNNDDNNDSAPGAAFEYQEMRATLQAMEQQDLTSRALQPTKRLELENYVRRVCQKRTSPVPLDGIAPVLPGTTWKLVFSTQEAVLGSLPPDTTIYLKFHRSDDNKLAGTEKGSPSAGARTTTMGGTVDYVLQFGKKTFGLDNIKAESKWTVFDGTTSNNNNNYPGLVTLAYDKITTDAFGLQNIGVGLFGMLQGRETYIQSAYMDGSFWIERAFDASGNEYFSVYVRQQEQMQQQQAERQEERQEEEEEEEDDDEDWQGIG